MGPLREWAESLLRPPDLKTDGLLDARRVRDVWDETLAGRTRSEVGIWAVLMYRAWRERWMSGQGLGLPSVSVG